MSSEKKILEMVREQLNRPNPPSTEALYGRAVRIDESIRELSLRQFNARYPLRVRRAIALAEKRDEDGENATEEPNPQDRRDEIRSILMDFARDVALTAGGPSLVDLIRVEVDQYIDRMVTVLSTDGTDRRN